ncbi:MAG: crotonase/enoyl-CoA hydratase family protein [Fuerstiella sp.]|nr:crotonase/enoyl-CoA hydratase family protein [Fuerstiella sp.]
MTWECFDVSIEDRIAHIVMNRPEKRNCMCESFWTDLPAIVQDIDQNARARVIVISSTGPHFSSGIDLEILTGDGAGQADKNNPQHGAAFIARVTQLQQSFNALENSRLPVIAAIQGGCIGGGVDLVTACDLRYATTDAFLSIYEINVGMTADVGTFPRITNLVPEGVARELAYTGRRMPAAEAKTFGLVNDVFEDHQTMLEHVMKIATDISERAPLAVYGCKRAITYARDHSTADTLDHIGIWNTSMLVPQQIAEAMQAAADNRSPQFCDLPVIN